MSSAIFRTLFLTLRKETVNVRLRSYVNCLSLYYDGARRELNMEVMD